MREVPSWRAMLTDAETPAVEEAPVEESVAEAEAAPAEEPAAEEHKKRFSLRGKKDDDKKDEE